MAPIPQWLRPLEVHPAVVTAEEEMAAGSPAEVATGEEAAAATPIDTNSTERQEKKV